MFPPCKAVTHPTSLLSDYIRIQGIMLRGEIEGLKERLREDARKVKKQARKVEELNRLARSGNRLARPRNRLASLWLSS